MCLNPSVSVKIQKETERGWSLLEAQRQRWIGSQRAGTASWLVGPVALSPGQDSSSWWEHIVGQAAHPMAKK